MIAENLRAIPDKSETKPSSNKTDIEKLKHVIKDIDCFSQESLESIASLTVLLQLSMESPLFYKCPSNLHQALTTIHTIACDLKNSINVMAEDVGCNYSNNDDDGIWRAFHEANASKPQKSN
jgi:hypothetical protein